MFAKMFICAMLGAFYASGWWAWALLPFESRLLPVFLVIIATVLLFISIAITFFDKGGRLNG